jgi:hypothetical protein
MPGKDLNEIDEKVLELKDDIRSIAEVVIMALEVNEGKSLPQDLRNDIEKLQKCAYFFRC